MKMNFRCRLFLLILLCGFGFSITLPESKEQTLAYWRDLLDQKVPSILERDPNFHLLYWTVTNNESESFWFDIKETPFLSNFADSLDVTLRGLRMVSSGHFVDDPMGGISEYNANSYFQLHPGESITIPFNLRSNYFLPLNGTYSVRTRDLRPNCHPNAQQSLQTSLSSDAPSFSTLTKQQSVMERFRAKALIPKEEMKTWFQTHTLRCPSPSDEIFVTITDALLPELKQVQGDFLNQVKEEQNLALDLISKAETQDIPNLAFTISNNQNVPVSLNVQELLLSSVIYDRMEVWFLPDNQSDYHKISTTGKRVFPNHTQHHETIMFLQPGEKFDLYFNPEHYFAMDFTGTYLINFTLSDDNDTSCLQIDTSLLPVHHSETPCDTTRMFVNKTGRRKEGEKDFIVKKACTAIVNQLSLNITKRKAKAFHLSDLALEQKGEVDWQDMIDRVAMLRYKKEQPVRLLYSQMINKENFPLKFQFEGTPFDHMFSDF